MATYLLLTRMTPAGGRNLKSFQEMNLKVSEILKQEALQIRWIASYAVLGPYDYVDIFEAADNEAAARLALIIRSLGHATTEVWPAVSWERIREITPGTAA